jgi:hypothetical protein
VVVDARAHMLGRLASIVAKQILSGHHVVRSSDVCCSHQTQPSSSQQLLAGKTWGLHGLHELV